MKKTAWLCVVMFLLLGTALAGNDRDARPKTAEEAVKVKITKPGIKGTLKDAIERVATLGKVRILVDWSALSDAGAQPETRISLLVPAATVGQLLDMALAQAAQRGRPLSWYTENNAVHVTTQSRAMTRNRFPLGRPTSTDRGKAKTARTSGGPVAELNFQNVEFADTIKFFRAASGVNFHVNWKALETVGVGKTTAVSLQVKDISIAQALDLILSDLNVSRNKYDSVYWVVDKGVVEISTGAALDTTLSTRTYDVTDLLTLVPDFEGPRLDLSREDQKVNSDNQSLYPGNGLFQTEDNDNNNNTEEKSTSEQRAELREKLIGIIKQSIGDDMWQPNGKGDVRIFRNQLVISQTKLGFKLLEEAARK